MWKDVKIGLVFIESFSVIQNFSHHKNAFKLFVSRYPSQFREIAIDPQISTADGENSTQRQMKFPKLDQLFPKNLTKVSQTRANIY